MRSSAPAVLLCLALFGLGSISAQANGSPMSMADVSEKASAESKAQQRIERLADGRVLVSVPMQDLEAVIGLTGAALRSTDDAGEASFHWQVTAVGRESAPVPLLMAGEIAIDGEVVSVQRPGVVEEFRVNADGLRQDFVVPVRPQGEGELVVDLDVHGATLAALPEQDDQAVEVRMADGRLLHYHALHVTDARGEVLAARMAVNDRGGLRIAVRDAGAAYPVRIDPTFTDADWTALDGPDFNGSITAIAVAGSQVYVGGSFTTAGGVAASRIAMWNGSSWSALGSGMNNGVQSLAWDAANGRLYAGGGFTTAGGVAASRIAMWNGSSWLALGSGVNNAVMTLAWDAANSRLYAGGFFDTAGGVSANRIAVWNGSSWSALGSGTNSTVNALAWDADNSRLYAGGAFTTAGGTAANNIAVWDGSSWSALGSGADGTVEALAWDAAGQRLYAGGSFSIAGGVLTGPVAAWDGSNWATLGAGFDGPIYALAWDAGNSRLFAGGAFTTVGGTVANYIAVWDGSSWAALGSGMNLNVRDLAWDADNNRLFAGGDFTTAGGTAANRIATWDGSSWAGLGGGMNNSVYALAWDAGNGRLYAGGFFTTTGGGAANRIAVWNGSSWSALGSGVDSDVRALAWDAGNGRLYAGGFFGSAGGVAANNIAVWNGSSWAALGGGVDSAVEALAWDAAGQRLYVGGFFTTAGGAAANRIAVWDGSAWAALGGGMDGGVTAVAWDAGSGRLYAGGSFSTAGGGAASNIAAWDGSNWAPLGSGINGNVRALAWDAGNGRLFAGGFFTTAGGVAANRIAVWSGSSWAALTAPGNGMDGEVSALAWDAGNSRLYAGGFFTTAGGTPANRIAVWNGSGWAALGSGTDAGVRALAWDAGNGRLYVGGFFTIAGGKAARVAQAQFGLAQSITFANPGARNFGTAPTLSATSSSGLAVSFSSATTGVCTITSGGALTFVTAGTCTINADQAGDATYDPAPQVQQSFTVNAVVPGAPTVGTATAGDTQASLAFTAPASGGGAAITGYTVTSNPGGFTGTGAGSPITVTGLTNGVSYTFTVTATNSAGTGAASAASNSVTPAAPQTITFANPGAQNFGTTPTLSASSTSGLTVTFTSSTTGVCTITTGGALTFVTAGTCTINADQAGGSGFLPASQVSRSFTVNAVVPGAPTIGTAVAGDTQASVAFTAPTNTGGTSITGYTVSVLPPHVGPVNGASSPIVVNGLTNGQAYTFTVTADNSAGTGPASAASNSVTPRAAQTITFANPGAQNFGITPTLSATTDSGLTVVFTSSTTGVCTITTGGALTFVTAGTCTINADQAGNGSYLPAPQVSRTFTVNAVVPGAPTIGTATAGNAQATVAFTAPASTGGAAITGYTVTSNPGGITGTGAGSPITVSGLANGTAYTFTVTATNSAGTGTASAASAPVTPQVAETATPPVLRPDRVVVRENSGAVEVDVLANDDIASVLLDGASLAIATAPTRGAALVLTQGTPSVVDDVIRYTPNANTSGADAFVYRVCFSGSTPCAEARVTVEVRPLAGAAIEFSTDRDRGFRDETLDGLRALPSARFEAHGLVAPVVANVTLDAVADADAPWGPGRTATVIRPMVGGTAARDWRVLVDARSITGGDVDLYLGLDSNDNAIADPSELVCSSAMAAAERCDLALTAPANGTARYWVLVHSATAGQSARLEMFETPLDVPAAQRSLVVTGPGSLVEGESFPLRLSWDDATVLPGQSRGGWVQVLAAEGASVGWVPVRINRLVGEPTAFALESGVDHTLALGEGQAHERLYIDVPTGATQLSVTTTSGGFIDVYLARVPPLAQSAATPTVAPAPPRNEAVASGTAPGGNENVVVANPAAGRWYVTPVNSPLANATTVTVRATVTAVAPQVRPGGYFNPSRSGNGLFLYPAGSERAGLFYTYLQDGTPTWYYLQAAAPGANGLWRGTIFRSAWNGNSNRLTKVGEATITPMAGDAFTFNYSIDGETGSEAYSNFSGACPTVNGAPLDISGHWFDPARAGSGYSVQTFPDYEFYLVFGYDAQGVPRYLVAERPGVGGITETVALEQLRGSCLLCERSGNPTRTTVGSLQRRIEGGTLRNITLTATYVDGVPGAWAANDAVIPLGELRGCTSN